MANPFSRVSRLTVFVAATLLLILPAGAADVVTYAGGTGKEEFNCVLELSDGTILVGGVADNLDWLPSGTTKTELSATVGSWSMPAATGAFDNRYGFIMHLKADLSIDRVLYFPQDKGGAIKAIKTTSKPGDSTGDILISGQYQDGGAWWLGKLDNNFVSAAPTALAWGFSSQNSNYDKLGHDCLWDVGNDGKAVFYNYASTTWGVVMRLRADGTGLDTVPNWRNSHGYTQPNGDPAKLISLKPGNNCLRSQTRADFDTVEDDAYGKHKGKWPHDAFYSQPIEEGNTQLGYAGYKDNGTTATTFAVHIDRRNNDIYLGFNIQSKLPPWNDIPNAPDFEPAVIAYDKDGTKKWWSRLYTELSDKTGPFVTTDAGDTWAKTSSSHYLYGLTRDVSVAGSTWYVADRSSGVAKSTDAGATWAYVVQGITFKQMSSVCAVSATTVYAGSASGDIFKTADGGATWATSQTGIPSNDNEVTCIVKHPTTSSTLYCAISGTGIYKSTDSGANWTACNTGLTDTDVKYLAIDPTTPATLYAATFGGMFKSTDGGANWSEINTGMDATKRDFTSVAIDPNNSAIIYATVYKGAQGIYRSTDGGANWVSEKVGNTIINHVVLEDLGTTTMAYCGSADRAVYKRVPYDGNDWTSLRNNTGLSDKTWEVSRLVADGGKIYAFTAGSAATSSPDQYVDGIAVDYSKAIAQAEVVVLARSHGNNTTNFWSGSLDGTDSFHNAFTGNNGNEHLAWLCRLKGATGKLVDSCWVAEYDPWGSNFGSASTDANLDGWPSHNGGNAGLKTTNTHNLTVDTSGRVYVSATSRGPVTTTNAWQKMTKPKNATGGTGYGPWSDFVRVHTADFTSLTYSSTLSDPWTASDGTGGGNISIQSLWPTANGVLVVGKQDKKGTVGTGALATQNKPLWGVDYQNTSTSTATPDAVFAKFLFSSLTPLETWRNTYFSQTANTGNAANTADPDADGLANFLEYALGGDPTVSNTSILPAVATSIVSSSTYLTLTFTPQRSDVTYSVEASSDLAIWTALTMPALTVGQSATVTDSTALTSGTKRFLRLKVSQ